MQTVTLRPGAPIWMHCELRVPCVFFNCFLMFDVVWTKTRSYEKNYGYRPARGQIMKSSLWIHHIEVNIRTVGARSSRNKLNAQMSSQGWVFGGHVIIDFNAVAVEMQLRRYYSKQNIYIYLCSTIYVSSHCFRLVYCSSKSVILLYVALACDLLCRLLWTVWTCYI